MDRIRRMLGCDSYDASKYTGRGVYAAVLDSGTAPHPDLRERVVEFRDFTGERRARVQQRGMYDDNGHGTHVASRKNNIKDKASKQNTNISTVNSNLKMHFLYSGEPKVGTEYSVAAGTTLNYTAFFCALRWTPYQLYLPYDNVLHLNTVFVVEEGVYVVEIHALLKLYKDKNKFALIKAYQENRWADGSVTRFEIDSVPLAIYACNLIRW